MGESGSDKRVVLIRAGWHVVKDLAIPEVLNSNFCRPARRSCSRPSGFGLWSTKRIAKRPFEDLDELKGALVERCLTLSDHRDLLRGHTRYRWWPDAA